MGRILELMVKPWWLSAKIFTTVMILLGIAVVGWTALSWYVGEVFLEWMRSTLF